MVSLDLTCSLIQTRLFINADSKGHAIYIFKQLSPGLKTGYFYC